MKELIVQILGDEIWLKCPDHGLIKFIGSCATVGDITAAEQEHSTQHLIAQLDS